MQVNEFNLRLVLKELLADQIKLQMIERGEYTDPSYAELTTDVVLNHVINQTIKRLQD